MYISVVCGCCKLIIGYTKTAQLSGFVSGLVDSFRMANRVHHTIHMNPVSRVVDRTGIEPAENRWLAIRVQPGTRPTYL